jgi:hypothetical protein
MVKSSNPKRAQYLTHLPLSPYPRFSAELAPILLLSFSLFALVAALSQCLCSESTYLSIKLYRIYVCYMNITLYIAFCIIRDFKQPRYVLELITRVYGGTTVCADLLGISPRFLAIFEIILMVLSFFLLAL